MSFRIDTVGTMPPKQNILLLYWIKGVAVRPFAMHLNQGLVIYYSQIYFIISFLSTIKKSYKDKASVYWLVSNLCQIPNQLLCLLSLLLLLRYWNSILLNIETFQRCQAESTQLIKLKKNRIIFKLKNNRIILRLFY